MAAGLGFKTFTTGEVLTAADTNGYLMQGILVFASAAARDSAITSPQEGQFAYLKDTNVTTYYTGSAWANVDTTGMTNPMTTTGDIIYSSPGSTPVRLGIGSTSQVLTVTGGVPVWATPAGGGSMTLLSTTTLSGTSTTVSSISQAYKNLFVEVFGATWDTGNSNGAFATNHTSAISYKKVQTTDFGSAYLQTTCGDLDNNVDSWLNSGGNNYLNFTFYNYASTTTFKNFNITGSYNGTTNNGRVIQLFGGIASNTAMTSFTFKNTASYTLSAGTIRVYGVN